MTTENHTLLAQGAEELQKLHASLTVEVHRAYSLVDMALDEVAGGNDDPDRAHALLDAAFSRLHAAKEGLEKLDRLAYAVA